MLKGWPKRASHSVQFKGQVMVSFLQISLASRPLLLFKYHQQHNQFQTTKQNIQLNIIILTFFPHSIFVHKDCNYSFFIFLRFDPSKLPIFSTNLTIRHQEKQDEDIDQGILEDIEDLSDSDDSFDVPVRKNFRLPKSKLNLEEEKILKELDKKRHSISVEEPGNVWFWSSQYLWMNTLFLVQLMTKSQLPMHQT